jgi:hypothetical protein
MQVAPMSGSGQNFHHDGIGDGNVCVEEPVEPLADPRSGAA